MGALSRIRSSAKPTEGEGISRIADRYLDAIGGGMLPGFRQFTQNTGEPGPHDGPFWEQVSTP